MPPTAKDSATLTPDVAKDQYISSLQDQHKAALAEITDNQTKIAALTETISARQTQVRETMAQLRGLGVEVKTPEGFGPGRGRGRGRRTAGTTAAGKPRIRPQNDSNLEETIATFMNGSRLGTEFSIPDITAGVEAAGYKSSSATPKVILAQAVGRLTKAKALKRASRGVYVLTEKGRVLAVKAATPAKA